MRIVYSTAPLQAKASKGNDKYWQGMVLTDDQGNWFTQTCFWQSLTGGGGNPNLKPYRSTNLDFSGEWYFSPDAILAASIFYRDVSDYVLRISQEETHYNINQLRDAVFLVDRPQNAGDAKVKVALLPAASRIKPPFNVNELVAT